MKKLHFDPPDGWLAPPPPVWDPSAPAAPPAPEVLATPEASPAQAGSWRRRASGLTHVRAELVVAMALLAAVAMLVALTRGASDTPDVSLQASAFPPSDLGSDRASGIGATTRSDVNPTRTATAGLAQPLRTSGVSETSIPDRAMTLQVDPNARQPASTSASVAAAIRAEPARAGKTTPKARGMTHTPGGPRPSIASEPRARTVAGHGKQPSSKHTSDKHASDTLGSGKPAKQQSTDGPAKHQTSTQCKHGRTS